MCVCVCVFGAAVVSKIEIKEMAETAENMAGVLRGYLKHREENTGLPLSLFQEAPGTGLPRNPHTHYLPLLYLSLNFAKYAKYY